MFVNPSAAPQSPPAQSSAATSQIPGVAPNLFDVINVMAPPFSAKGDCKTNDHDAIYAALEAAYRASTPAAVYFPTPPHGCYLTSTLPFLGVTMTGNPRGLGRATPGEGPTEIRGMPGEDILQITDPNTTTPQVPHHSYTISNLYLVVDDSQDVSSLRPNRIPGRSVTDGAMSSGSTLLTSRHALWSLGDVGQAITVAGAGPSGTTLTTIIASVNSVGGASTSTVTLAEAASTSVTGAAVYISLAGLPATARVGNCALAIDNSDGKSADWKVNFGGFAYPIWRDVTVTSVSGASHNSSCAIYLQGQWGTQYGATFDNLNVLRTVYGFVIGDFTINPQLGSVGSDFLTLRKGLWQSLYPLITYDGGEDRLQEIQIGSSGAGPQILQVGSGVETGAEGWNIEIPEVELTTQGMRLEGQQQLVTNTTLAGGSTKVITYWDASNSICINCSARGTLYVNGTGNQIQLTSGVDPNVLLHVIDNGIGNVVTGQRESNPTAGDIPTRLTAIGTPFRGGPPVESRSNDSLLDGLPAAPYFNNYDLFLEPQDLGFNGGIHPPIVLDDSSFTGRYVALKDGGATGCIALFNATRHPCKMQIGGSLAGANVPATEVNVYVMAKCPAITSYTFTVRANRTVVNSGTFTCAAAYTVQSLTANLSSYGGNDLGFSWSAGEVDVAYVAVVPYLGNLYSSGKVYADGFASPPGTWDVTALPDTGVYSSPFYNTADLFLAPSTWTGGDSASTAYVANISVPVSGGYRNIPSSGSYSFTGANGGPVKVGETVPQTMVRTYVMAQAGVSASQNCLLRDVTKSKDLNLALLSFGPSFAVQYWDTDLASLTSKGDTLQVKCSALNPATTLQVAWIALRPYPDSPIQKQQSDYWNIQPGLFARDMALGPAYFFVAPSAIVAVTARLSGPISCSDAPTVTILDLGVSPTTNYESAKVLKTLATGTADGAYSTTGFAATVKGGHYVGLGFSAGTCATPPTIDVTTTVQ